MYKSIIAEALNKEVDNIIKPTCQLKSKSIINNLNQSYRSDTSQQLPQRILYDKQELQDNNNNSNISMHINNSLDDNINQCQSENIDSFTSSKVFDLDSFLTTLEQFIIPDYIGMLSCKDIL